MHPFKESWSVQCKHTLLNRGWLLDLLYRFLLWFAGNYYLIPSDLSHVFTLVSPVSLHSLTSWVVFHYFPEWYWCYINQTVTETSYYIWQTQDVLCYCTLTRKSPRWFVLTQPCGCIADIKLKEPFWLQRRSHCSAIMYVHDILVVSGGLSAWKMRMSVGGNQLSTMNDYNLWLCFDPCTYYIKNTKTKSIK